MLIEDSFIKKYYKISLFFVVISLFEAFSYFFRGITILNFVYLLFEMVWLVYSIVMVIYIKVHDYPKPLLSLPLLYFAYFLISFLYLFMVDQPLEGVDREMFIRNNAIIVICFSVFSIVAYGGIWKQYFRRYF